MCKVLIDTLWTVSPKDAETCLDPTGVRAWDGGRGTCLHKYSPRWNGGGRRGVPGGNKEL